jgi:hypothetical protein
MVVTGIRLNFSMKQVPVLENLFYVGIIGQPLCGAASCEAAPAEERLSHFQEALQILERPDLTHEVVCSTGSDVLAFVSAVQVDCKNFL